MSKIYISILASHDYIKKTIKNNGDFDVTLFYSVLFNGIRYN